MADVFFRKSTNCLGYKENWSESVEGGVGQQALFRANMCPPERKPGKKQLLDCIIYG